MSGMFGIGQGFDNYLMQSSYDADRVITMFESAIEQGYNPVTVESEVWQQANVNPTNLTPFDKERIQLKVNEIWEMERGRRF